IAKKGLRSGPDVPPRTARRFGVALPDPPFRHSRESGCRQMGKTGFDGLILSGGGSAFAEIFPLTLSPSKGERVFVDSPESGNPARAGATAPPGYPLARV